MAIEQMGMPAAAPSPEEMAVYDQLRQTVSPKEFSDEMLAGASQVDPQAVAEFKQELEGLDMPPEVLDALNDLVDEILANPERYDELRQQYMEQGLPEDILPEQFDPQFFAALNMAIDQMIAAPAGPQAFAKGGIAELKPIAKALAEYGRNGDTMLAHITPAEARMLKRRGGSGTINPKTGLPEFFLKKIFKSVGKALKSIGNAVKKFASSTVGRLVTTVALGFFLGPAAASALGVSSAAGVAAVSGFVGSAGSTLLAGGNIRDALKAGAIGGLTAGAGAGIMGGSGAFASGSYTGPTTISGQWNKFTNAIAPGSAPTTAAPAALPNAPGAPAQIASPQAAISQPASVPSADPLGDFIQQNEIARTAANTPAAAPVPQTGLDPKNALTDNITTTTQRDAYITQQGLDKPPSYLDQAKDFYKDNISPSGIREAATPAAQEAGARAMADLQARMAVVGQTPTPAMLDNAYQTAFKAAMPGTIATYGPMAAAGLGIMGLAGGFQSKPVEGGDITKSLMTPATDRIRQQGSERQFYIQGLPGVQYNDRGEPIAGGFTGSLPTYDVPDYGGGMGPGGIMQLPTLYSTPAGAIGSRQVPQPYNTASMYTNLLPRYAEGGPVQYFDEGGDAAPVTSVANNAISADQRARLPAGFNWEDYTRANPDLGRAGIDTESEAVTHWLNQGIKENRVLNAGEVDQRNQAAAATAAQQKAARDAAAQQRAMRRAQGSGTMYANINAGLAALAPEVNPMDTSDISFGARARQAQMANLQQTYAPILVNQAAARMQQERALGQAPSFLPSANVPAPQMDRYSQMVQDQYARIGRSGFGQATNQIDVPGFNAFVNELQSGRTSPGQLPGLFDTAVQDYMTKNPNDRYTQYVQQYRANQPTGIAALAEGGYPRRNGQIDGPGTETSDSIPAMLSDGEFVMTAKAVRGMGNGSRREGAKKMYKLMHQLERNAQRG